MPTGSSIRRSSRSKEVGDWAEQLILNYLTNSNEIIQKLNIDQTKDIVWEADNGNTPGWDISFTTNTGEVVGVEVKGTISSKMTNFEMTANEYIAASENKTNYIIALVSNVGNNPTIELITDPLGALSATPSSYVMRAE